MHTKEPMTQKEEKEWGEETHFEATLCNKWGLDRYLEMKVGHGTTAARASSERSTGVQWVDTNMRSPQQWRVVHTWYTPILRLGRVRSGCWTSWGG